MKGVLTREASQQELCRGVLVYFSSDTAEHPGRLPTGHEIRGRKEENPFESGHLAEPNISTTGSVLFWLTERLRGLAGNGGSQDVSGMSVSLRKAPSSKPFRARALESPPRACVWLTGGQALDAIRARCVVQAPTPFTCNQIRSWKRGRTGLHETFLGACVPGQKGGQILLSERPVLWAFEESHSTRPPTILFGQEGLIILRRCERCQPRQCLAVIPRHPLRWASLQLPGVPQ